MSVPDPLPPFMLWLSGSLRICLRGDDRAFAYCRAAAAVFVSIGDAGEPQPFEQRLITREVGARMHPFLDGGNRLIR
jgi:hypothetical protein